MLSLIADMTLGDGLISSRAKRTAAMRDAAMNKAFLDLSSPMVGNSVGENIAKVNYRWYNLRRMSLS